MQQPTRFAVPNEPEALWTRYFFALAFSFLALLLDIGLNHNLERPASPFLAGSAAVIASAAWAGFGPGLLATALVTAWCAAFLRAEGCTAASVFLRCAIFFGEGLLLSVGSERLRRISRRALQSEEWHRSLIDTSNEGIWVVDAAGTVTYANPRMAEILGCRAEEITGKKAEEFFLPDDLPIERIRFQHRRAGQREQFDRRLRRKDGSEAWVLACCSFFAGRRGDAGGILAMMTDITERKRAEHALRRSEERFRGLFENVLEGVYQSTPDGRIVAANPMLLNMLGLVSERELNDVNIARDLYIDPNVRKRLLERLEAEGSFRNVEYQLRRRDGKAITVRENARAVRDEEGRVAYYEGTVSDVTEMIQIEHELEKAKHRESVETIAASMPHEFRNILTVISGYSQLMLEDLPASHPAHETALNILRTVEGASLLTAQLVAFSNRAEQGVVDINRTILLSRAAHRRSAEDAPLSLALSPWSLPVHAEQEHVEQLLEDLMRGARGVSAEAVCIDSQFVRSHEEARIGLFARVTVEAAQRWQPVNPRQRELAGRCGGFVVSGEPSGGAGSCSVYLPIAEEAAAFLVSRLSNPKPRETILLLEEEPLIREVSRDLLERQGYGVMLAADAGEAERIANYGHRFDLLIADLYAPCAGAELARRFRLTRPDLKVLLIAAKTDRRAEADWADGYLERPFSAESLSGEIRRILG